MLPIQNDINDRGVTLINRDAVFLGKYGVSFVDLHTIFATVSLLLIK
jgi:hypothetical protein